MRVLMVLDMLGMVMLAYGGIDVFIRGGNIMVDMNEEEDETDGGNSSVQAYIWAIYYM